MRSLTLKMCDSCYQNIATRGIKGAVDPQDYELDEPADAWVFVMAYTEEYDIYRHECESPEDCFCTENSPRSHSKYAYEWADEPVEVSPEEMAQILGRELI